jgi:hypothetical protein
LGHLGFKLRDAANSPVNAQHSTRRHPTHPVAPWTVPASSTLRDNNFRELAKTRNSLPTHKTFRSAAVALAAAIACCGLSPADCEYSSFSYSKTQLPSRCLSESLSASYLTSARHCFEPPANVVAPAFYKQLSAFRQHQSSTHPWDYLHTIHRHISQWRPSRARCPPTWLQNLPLAMEKRKLSSPESTMAKPNRIW